MANALLGAVTAAALASASISGLQASKADASALTAYALQSTVDTSSEVDSTTLLNAVTTAALDRSSARRTPGRRALRQRDRAPERPRRNPCGARRPAAFRQRSC